MPCSCEQSFVKFWTELSTLSSPFCNRCILTEIIWMIKPGKKSSSTCKTLFPRKTIYVCVHFTSTCGGHVKVPWGIGQLFLVQDIWHPWPFTPSNANTIVHHNTPGCLKMLLSGCSHPPLKNFFIVSSWAWIQPCNRWSKVKLWASACSLGKSEGKKHLDAGTISIQYIWCNIGQARY